jgi:catechol 2,3-dioxygenase-like lactoylglutathione lyase family enzyme
MIKSHAGHMQINIDLQNLPFYKDLLGLLGWSVLYEDPNILGMGDPNGVSLWFAGVTKDVQNDYDSVGMNHLGISVDEQSSVDEVVNYLKEHGVPALFETPRHRPEFCQDAAHTYYQVMFESPDRVLLEVVYTGPKSLN